ncbi:MAG: protein kinase, partial [Candidatus Thermoplasmatota archaeon]|nr:protein kinase [Candidatus Thermoplasmatota archaeon]
RQSVVWKAKRRRKDGSIEEQVVVVKYPITAGDVGRRFLKEAEMHKKLKHSGIAQVYDYDNTHIEMEWIEGDNLREYVKKKPREEVLAGVFYDCIDPLLYAWKMHKVVNTDLKPEHIIIVGGNKVKLIDWGGCFRMGSISRSDELVYTPQWAAPELLKGGKFPNEKTMTCILGRIMYWAYTGIEPEKEDIGKDLESSEELKDNPEIKELIMDCVKGEQEKRIGLIEIAERLNDLYNLGKDVEQLRAYRRADRKQGIVINETRKLIEEYEEKNVVKEISEVLEDEDIKEILKERMEGNRKLKELYEQIKGDLEECMERGQELNDRMKENINSFFEKLNK